MSFFHHKKKHNEIHLSSCICGNSILDTNVVMNEEFFYIQIYCINCKRQSKKFQSHSDAILDWNKFIKGEKL